MEPLIGIIVALVFILGGSLVEGGKIQSILGGPAAMIVLGGTLGAVIVQFPFVTLKGALSGAVGCMKKSKLDPQKVLDEIVDYANRARRDGILALEKVAPTASDPFLSKALMMAIDGADSTTLRETMEIAIGQQEEHGEDGAKVFEAAGGYTPTVGIIGAVLGLIHVMSNLSDINAVGEGIASAFVATVYGVAAANIIFLPFAGRIKMRVREEMQVKDMMLTGVLAIQEGMNPKLVRERLSEFVPKHGDKKERPPQHLRARRHEMARKKKHPEHVNHERWLVSYADFMTLLFAFFVVMFASSQVDTQKVGRFTESFSKAVGIEVFPESGKSLLGGNSAKDAVTIAGKGDQSLPVELEELRAMMAQKVKQDELTGVQVLIRRNEIVLRLADNVVFASGTDEIQPAARVVLAHMADDLKDRKLDIRVEGHTDDKPIKTFRFRSNWDLSTSRATAVVADFASAGIDPARLSAAGYGEFHPIATNASPEGRAQNRRVDVVLSAQLIEAATPTSPDAYETDAGKQLTNEKESKDGGSDAPAKPEKQARNDVLPIGRAKSEEKP